MMKTLLIVPLLVFGVLIGATPMANAQVYGYQYTGTPAYGVNSCVTLTAYQQVGSTDLETGGQVTILQNILNRDGYLSGVSGTFDYGTYGAVVNYQRAHGIAITGTLGPITRQVINQETCGGSVYNNGSTYNSNVYGTGCTWNGSTYVCSYPSVPATPVYNSGYGNCGNSYGYYSNTCNSTGYYNGYQNNYGYNQGVVLTGSTVNYTYGVATITLTGTGFTTNGNTVYFGSSAIANVTSYNGTTITFTAPTGYYAGTYGIYVKNSVGFTSNTLQYTMNTNYQNGNYNNGYYNGYQNQNGYVNNNSSYYYSNGYRYTY